MFDTVRNPSHYVEGRKYEPKDVIRDWGLNFNLGNAVKYIARAGRKSDIIEDLKKAQQYIQFEIDALEADQEKVTPPLSLPNCRCVSDTGDRGVIELVQSIDELAGMSSAEFLERYCENGTIPLKKYRFKAGLRSYCLVEVLIGHGGKVVTLGLMEIREAKRGAGRRFSRGRCNEMSIVLR